MLDPHSCLDDPRQHAIRQMMDSVAPDIWHRNQAFIRALREEIRRHPVSVNPAIALLNDGAFDTDALRLIHLEYRHAIVQVFTDALLMAQFQTRQLEDRFAPGTKLAPRFLLTLNCLDEFGFQPGVDAQGYYRGNPAQAHYPLFERVLDALHISLERRAAYRPSSTACELRDMLEANFDRLEDVVALLAVAEEEVILYSPPLRNAVHALGIDVHHGYYHVHGTRSDADADGYDDDHQDDLWAILAQAMMPSDHGRIRTLCLDYCDLWDRFWHLQTALHDGLASRPSAPELSVGGPSSSP